MYFTILTKYVCYWHVKRRICDAGYRYLGSAKITIKMRVMISAGKNM